MQFGKCVGQSGAVVGEQGQKNWNSVNGYASTTVAYEHTTAGVGGRSRYDCGARGQ